jgi:hypothetical protein
LGRSDRAVDDPGAHIGEIGGEAAIEADLQHNARGARCVDRAIRVVQRQRHRFLAEHVLTGMRGGDHQVGVCGGG